MPWSFVEIAGYSNDDLEIIAIREDVEEFSRLIDTLVEHREQVGLTQKDVAERLDTKQSVISRTESTGGNPTVRRLMAYARAVGLRLRFVPEVRDTTTWENVGTVSDASMTVDADGDDDLLRAIADDKEPVRSVRMRVAA